MILRKSVSVRVLVFLVICVLSPDKVFGSSSLNHKSSRGKSKSSKSSASGLYQSSQNYGRGTGATMLRPSKPDPHFEILDEQRAYYNYGGKIREGRSSTLGKKTSHSNESPKKSKCCNNNNKKGRSSSASPSASSSSSGINSSVLKEIPSPAFSSHSGRFSVETLGSRFSKKSLDENEFRGFSGSQLISGDAGMLSQRVKSAEKERVGWKILMGPSVSSAEEEVKEERTTQPESAISKREFTQINEGDTGKRRTITKLKEVGGHGHKKKEKHNNVVHSTDYDDIISEHYVSSPSSNSGQKGKRGRTTYKSSSLRSMPEHAPKQKYASISRRAPHSKSHSSHSSSSSSSSNSSKQRSTKKLQMSQSSKNSFKASPPMKPPPPPAAYTTTSNSGSFEEDLNSLRSSAVMTLDTKKLMLEPGMNSVEPTVQNTMVSSMSRETYSGEIRTPHPSQSSFVSRYETITIPRHEDMMMEDEPDHLHQGGDDGNRFRFSQDDGSHFQTKTALNINPTSSEYPTYSVSASMNYAKGSKHHRREPGIVTSASDEIPHYQNPTPSRSRSRQTQHQSIRHHVDHLQHQHFPSGSAVVYGNDAQGDDPRNISPEVVDNPNMIDDRGFVVNTVIKHPRPKATPPQILDLSSKLQLPHFLGQLHTIEATPSKLPPVAEPAPEILPQPAAPLPTTGSSFQHQSHAGHHIPYILPPHHPPHFHRPLFPPHRHPIPLPMPPLQKPPLFPPHFDPGSGRKAPPGELGFGIGKFPLQHSPPPPIGIDPAHPVVQHALKNPQSILNDGVYIEPTDSTSLQDTTKKYFHNFPYNIHKNTLIPLDKRLVYLSMIFSWMFWITTIYTYSRYYVNGNHNKQMMLTVPPNGENPQVTTRSLDTSSPWNFTKVLEYIEIAQKTYEGFDWQDLNCQKRTLCELVQKQNDPWGETGRKLANSYVYRIMDALDGVPIPQLIQTYLRQYKEAISQGKNSQKDCGQIYSQCKFSIKDVLNKAQKKKA